MRETLMRAESDGSGILRLVACSELRKELVLSLRSGTATLADLRQETGASSTAAIHALRELEKVHLTYQDSKRNYLLTNIGHIVASQLEDFSHTLQVLSEHHRFWLEHDLRDIPETFLEKLGSLQESYLVTSTPTEVMKVFSTFVTLLENSRVIKGLSAMFFPELITTFAGLVPQGIDIDLIVTREVLDKMLELSDIDELKTALEGNFTLLVAKQNPKIAFTVTDYFLSVGLFRWDGTYDDANDLLSYNKDALNWGQKLYDYYASLSEPVYLQD
jgi:predicted transcriptional regulator